MKKSKETIDSKCTNLTNTPILTLNTVQQDAKTMEDRLSNYLLVTDNVEKSFGQLYKYLQFTMTDFGK